MSTTLFVAPAPPLVKKEDLTARRWAFQQSPSGALLGDRQVASSVLPRPIGEAPPVVSIYCHVSFQSTLLASFQASSAARRNVREYLRAMGKLAVEAMEASASATTPTSGDDPTSSAAEMTVVGVVLQLHDPTLASDQMHHPWEFHRIDNLDSDEDLHQAEQALAALRLSGTDSGHGRATRAVAARAATLAADGKGDDEDGDTGSGPGLFAANPQRLSLYVRHVPRYTGVYPACVICVKGTAFKRDNEGRVTALLVRHIFTPRRPSFPWELPGAPLNLGLSMRASMADRQGARVQFLSGPFPRLEVHRIATAIVKQATLRGVNVVVICGPLFPPYGPGEEHLFARNTRTFSDQQEHLVDVLESEIEAAQNTITRFILVPSVEDAMCFPVVPQPCFAISVGDVAKEEGGEFDEPLTVAKAAVQVASNPCEIVINSGYPPNVDDSVTERRRLAAGVRCGVTSFDSVSLMRDEMVERYPDADGNSLHRVAETVLASRLYVPLVSAPSPNHDLQHLNKLLVERDAAGSFGQAKVHEAAQGNDAPNPQDESSSKPCPPHILFMPSIRPPFALVSHSGSQDLSAPVGRGSLLVNQGAWNTRQKGIPFRLNIAEVTMPSIRAVALGGASEANGVTVALVEIFDADS